MTRHRRSNGNGIPPFCVADAFHTHTVRPRLVRPLCELALRAAADVCS